ncbi:MAG: bifunctional diaminohydroxyphosphoribosylaminopyrimidine deaminase/5-amino-6-(5-phosphoribosylamino)uracil reductase RibD [Phenylobacterium sp.]|uniref:bifunctional diaminohydroxyphosphoribosylaminopyrimidine deaminase/5-amino-6-(5-phosphoribosylamino)uracil reductase RibD n=1 Tax=Phenylobacterium sp. TaxID=1871053 RepID=UPI001B60A4D0|nr:bifunctional diaminohydroxyphosphoribosylaminopyrimidine deaminase/5-amino-6-(5-phosphoribosylamino)uracil reductase RibD [Phenylobacterium sp.]MBP7649447.1 bifunctional diaminohydroxyphosphoribosylaminopyrimidine deaminase/5-amino-6-(5-phosphoribosylamino)uracil reductase RibD [Phenylobacterium sp.]MBP7817176.1 bifunctional diaminohydroxyphosphoribosylaminopyrimidine deaminase/5-amino-6-(5-phosphoribosylamino)uracil reductase RibD [Phenylobacterium sp.]MBP9230283.1 bifunctional diaminohydrox
MTDEAHMRAAIALARTHLGKTGANPSVGCVIVAGGDVVGQGVTQVGGRPHAEEQALVQAGEAARGATAYVTLEPCGQRSAGTASCSERLVAAGIARVVIACTDASTYASGRGTERLRSAGLTVELGVLQTEAAGLYVGYEPPKA